MKLLDYVEGEAKANAEFQIACRDAVLKEVNTTVAGLFGGGVGALAYAVNLLEKPNMAWAAWAMGACSLYLLVLAFAVVWFCLKTQEVFPPGNDPGLLLKAEELNGVGEDEGLTLLRMANLHSKQWCIDQNRSSNKRVAQLLDQLRLAAIAVPVVFVIAAWAARGACLPGWVAGLFGWAVGFQDMACVLL